MHQAIRFDLLSQVEPSLALQLGVVPWTYEQNRLTFLFDDSHAAPDSSVCKVKELLEFSLDRDVDVIAATSLDEGMDIVCDALGHYRSCLGAGSISEPVSRHLPAAAIIAEPDDIAFNQIAERLMTWQQTSPSFLDTATQFPMIRLCTANEVERFLEREDIHHSVLIVGWTLSREDDVVAHLFGLGKKKKCLDRMVIGYDTNSEQQMRGRYSIPSNVAVRHSIPSFLDSLPQFCQDRLPLLPKHS